VGTNEMLIERIQKIERFVRTVKALSFLGLVVFVCLLVIEKYVSATPPNDRVLHVRGIVIEDSKGVPRLLLGAPISNEGRKRRDTDTGVILLGERHWRGYCFPKATVVIRRCDNLALFVRPFSQVNSCNGGCRPKYGVTLYSAL